MFRQADMKGRSGGHRLLSSPHDWSGQDGCYKFSMVTMDTRPCQEKLAAEVIVRRDELFNRCSPWTLRWARAAKKLVKILKTG